MNSRILIHGVICLGEEVHVLLWYIDSVGDDQGSSSFGCRTALLLDLCQALVHDTSFAFRSCHSYIVSGIARSAGESLRLAKCVTSGPNNSCFERTTCSLVRDPSSLIDSS